MRDGVGAARVRLPRGGVWPRVLDFLGEISGDPEGMARRMADGEVVWPDGSALAPDTPFRGGAAVFLYRDLPEEVPVPGEIPVLLRDDATGLLAVDKPPFLATMPRGRHVVQTAVVRLRRELNLPELAPVHRLDRLTSGVLLLTMRREVRGAYQGMVQAGGLEKTYEALAPLREDLPPVVENRLIKPRGDLQVRAVPGESNARTRLRLDGECVVDGERVGRYVLSPSTGRTHQLRVHLAGLGVPILGDPLYPTVRDVPPDDMGTPLQLCARRVAFVDPVSGAWREIGSGRDLPIAGAALS